MAAKCKSVKTFQMKVCFCYLVISNCIELIKQEQAQNLLTDVELQFMVCLPGQCLCCTILGGTIESNGVWVILNFVRGFFSIGLKKYCTVIQAWIFAHIMHFSSFSLQDI